MARRAAALQWAKWRTVVSAWRPDSIRVCQLRSWHPSAWERLDFCCNLPVGELRHWWLTVWERCEPRQVWDPDTAADTTVGGLYHKHKTSPYVGKELKVATPPGPAPPHPTPQPALGPPSASTGASTRSAIVCRV